MNVFYLTTDTHFSIPACISVLFIYSEGMTNTR